MVVSLLTIIVSWAVRVVTVVSTASLTLPVSWPRRVSHAVKPITSANAANTIFILNLPKVCSAEATVIYRALCPMRPHTATGAHRLR